MDANSPDSPSNPVSPNRILLSSSDPVVGRDVLFGITLAVGWRAMEGVGDFLAGNSAPGLDSTATLQGIRSTFSVVAILVPGSIRAMLVFLFVLFLLRIVLRNEWAAVVAFALI